MPITSRITRAASLSVVSVAIVSCASSFSHQITAIHVPPTQYEALNCDQLSIQLVRLSKIMTDLAASIDKKASSDRRITGGLSAAGEVVPLAAIVFLPAAFSLGGNEAQEDEYARLMGEYDAVRKAGVEKNCQLDPNKTVKSPLIANYPAERPGESSALDFYGEAEEELNSGNTDKYTWARALVKAEDDETKVKAKYIELRATELHVQNGGTISTASLNTQSVAVDEGQNIDISGVYASEITESGGRPNFTSKQRRMRITLEQNGKTITGTDSSRKIKINGTRNGNKIEFYIIRGNQIDGVWEINADATKLEGKWSTDGGGGGSGNWNLTRIE